MLKKTICVLLGSLVLQGCVDSHSVTAVVKNSVKFQSGDMLIYDVDIESSKHSCTILLSVMGKDLWALENEESLLKCLYKDCQQFDLWTRGEFIYTESLGNILF